MKTIIYSIFIGICLSTGITISAQNKAALFNPGDWFECEMEFENGLPVFRNHYWNKNKDFPDCELISLHFTYAGKDSSKNDKWNYKILRYKSLCNILTGESKSENIFCFDSWYPNYLNKNFDSVRNTLKGNFLMSNSKIVKHIFNFNIEQYFVINTFLPIQVDRKWGSVHTFGFYSTSTSESNNELSKRIEQIVNLIFQTSTFKKGQPTNIENYKMDGIKKVPGNATQFTLHLADNSGSYNAYSLPNGLAYAFSDKNLQKVLTITNASFAIPNKAVMNIIDQRTTINRNSKNYTDSIGITESNPAFVIAESGTPGYLKLTSTNNTKKYTLKSGTEFKFYHNSWYYVFLQPGDTVSILMKDDSTKLVERGKNNTWYQSHIKPSNEEIAKAPISAEFKSYLELQNEIIKRRDANNKETDMNVFKTSILDFFFLKSYHYNNTFVENDFSGFVDTYNRRKENLSNSNGSPLHVDFQYSFYESLVLHTDFPLYFSLKRILTGQYSYFQMGHDKQKFTDFISQCGDTLLTIEVDTRLKAFNSIQVGAKLPFTSLLNVNDERINILPAKGKYRLLLLNDVLPDISEYKKLTDSLPDYIESNSYLMDDSYSKQHPSKDSLFELHGYQPIQPLMKAFNKVIIVFDHTGTILYNSSFEKKYGKKDYLQEYREQIINAIEKSKSTSKSKWQQILLIAGISVLLTILFTWLIYRYRLNRINKLNAQEKLIQELKLKSVQAQLNPHFLFNALNSIQHLVNSNNNNQANQYLLGFSELLRNVLRNADEPLVPLTSELTIIKNYCELEKLRMDFDFQLDIKTNTHPDIIEVPYMLLQPIVENAIKHGISKNKEKGTLRVEITEADLFLHIKVLDNGPGFGVLSLEEHITKGKGLKLTIEKLQSLYGNDATLSISNSTETQGGIVDIKLKIG